MTAFHYGKYQNLFNPFIDNLRKSIPWDTTGNLDWFMHGLAPARHQATLNHSSSVHRKLTLKQLGIFFFKM